MQQLEKEREVRSIAGKGAQPVAPYGKYQVSSTNLNVLQTFISFHTMTPAIYYTYKVSNAKSPAIFSQHVARLIQKPSF